MARPPYAPREVRGLYAITPEVADTVQLCARVREALRGGARVVQYRNKLLAPVQQRIQAEALLALCREHHVPFIVNDDLELACAVDADGVHLGQTDGDLAAARARLGSARLLGASCYNRFELAQRAIERGADHVAFGSVFASTTKPGKVRAPLELFGRARTELGVPSVAIGGVTPENAPALVAAGADALAVISALFDAPDVAAQAQRFQRLYAAPA